MWQMQNRKSDRLMGDPGSGLLMEHVCRWVHTSLFVSSGPPGELREPPSHSASQRRLQSGPGQRVYRGQHLQTAALRPPLPVGAAHQDANTHQHSQRAHTLQRNQHSWLARRSGQKERHTHTHTHTHCQKHTPSSNPSHVPQQLWLLRSSS